MGIFDCFKKKKQTESKNQIVDNGENSLISTTLHNNYDGIRVEGDTLKRVYKGNIQNGVFIVPEYIKSIDMFAFSKLKNLKSVVLHSGIRYIAPTAFQYCENLTEVKGISSANTIKTLAGFDFCTSLEQIDVPQSVQLIGEGAFVNCKNLARIKLPNGCWSISNHAFAGCENLQSIEIPASMELISTNAFAGCKNLAITFIEDDKKYFEDYIKEQKENLNSTKIDDFYGYDMSSKDLPEGIKLSDREQEVLYDDLDIKYKKVDIGGKEILWTTGKVIIKPGALSGVKEVIVYNKDTISTIMKSGYKGKVTYIDREQKQAVSVDFQAVKDYKKRKISEAREMYYKQFLIPSGGTVSWLLNCEKNHYRGNGYTGNLVCKIPITFDSRIEIKDYTQPKSDVYGYPKEREEFYTSLTFYKKELDNHSIYSPKEYERGYSIYYPYGARFDKELLIQIGSALSSLIDNARNLPNNATSQLRLQEITNRQKQLLDLLLKGTNDKLSVTKIMEGIQLGTSSGSIKKAIYKKDWLPYFCDPMFTEFKEVEKYRKSKKQDEDTLSK